MTCYERLRHQILHDDEVFKKLEDYFKNNNVEEKNIIKEKKKNGKSWF
jgi:hypothetical protein